MDGYGEDHLLEVICKRGEDSPSKTWIEVYCYM